MLRTVLIPVPATSFLLYRDPGKPPVHFSYLFAGATELDPGSKLLPSVKTVKTLFYTQSSLPLVQLWSGRLQLDAFQNTVHIQNVLLGPLAYGGMQGLGYSFPESRLSRRSAFAPFLRPQPDVSLWPERADGTAYPGLAASVANCWQRPELNCLASVFRSGMRAKP
jgi:hypothetical protein